MRNRENEPRTVELETPERREWRAPTVRRFPALGAELALGPIDDGPNTS